MTMRRVSAVSLLLLLGLSYGKGWVGQGRVHRSDGDTCDLGGYLAMDSSGVEENTQFCSVGTEITS
ncbi:MAG: hypothetical protein NTX53_03065 [candidate division WOR-3 bacterium]|nr:hypothetical protein [candidate division WOR-3 bacterium]